MNTPNKTTINHYRHRGYECPSCGIFTHVFNDGPAPVGCLDSCCGSTSMILRWDNDVSESVVVTPRKTDPGTN